jgi:hypothetical protein
LSTSPLKFIVGIAAVVLGIAVLAQAYQTPSVPAAAVRSPSSLSPEPDRPKKQQKKEAGQPAADQPAGQQPAGQQPAGQQPAGNEPQVEGVEVGIYNGTDTAGLAEKVAKQLERKGYVAGEVANSSDVGASSTLTETTLYYRAGPDKIEAEELAGTIFEGAPVRKLPKDLDVDKGVQVAIFIGSDFSE